MRNLDFEYFFPIELDWLDLAWLKNTVARLRYSFKEILTYETEEQIEDAIERDYLNTLREYLATGTTLTADDIIEITLLNYCQTIANKLGLEPADVIVEPSGEETVFYIYINNTPRSFLEKNDVAKIIKYAKENA